MLVFYCYYPQYLSKLLINKKNRFQDKSGVAKHIEIHPSIGRNKSIQIKYIWDQGPSVG